MWAKTADIRADLGGYEANLGVTLELNLFIVAEHSY